MKRKILIALATALMVVSCAIGLAACDFGGGHSHDMTYHSAVDATCTEDGNIEYWYCDGCGKYFSDEEGKHEVTDITIAAKGHTWGDWEVTQEATCQEKGSKTRTCSVCNETESEEMPLAEHSYGEWQVTEKATCTEDGEQKCTCEVCGHEETQTLPALGHTWDDWQIVEEATCKDGLRKHVCETCGAEEEEIIPASGEHKYIDTVIPPTVDEPGYTLHKCEICGEEYKDTYVDITFTEGLAYQLSADKEYYILTGIGDAIDTYLYLPASVNNKPVKEIAAKAFKDNTEITGVYIGSGVEVIGDSAFDGCTSLKDITLFDSIKEIGVGAFEDTAYYNNRDNWENSALYIGSCLIDVRETALGTLDIKDGTHIIGAAAVADCGDISELIIPDTVQYINDSAFYNCSSLEQINVHDGVETIGGGVFSYCSSLQKLTLPFLGETLNSTETYIGYFFGMSDGYTNTKLIPKTLTEVVLTGGETIGDYAFYNLENLTDISLPDMIKSIGDYAFSGCSNLVGFVIPANVESIGTEAFKGCVLFKEIVVPENVISIGLGAFSGCSKLESITLPFVGQNLDGEGKTHFGYIFGAQSYSDNENNVPESLKGVEITKAKSIDDYAFYNCSSLTSITIPDSVTSIGEDAFWGCSALTSMSLPLVGEKAGKEMSHFGYIFGAKEYDYNNDYVPKALKEVTITGGTNIGNYLFSGCSGIKNINIHDSIKTIENNAFYNCNSLKSIVIPDSVTSIGDDAFSGCSSLTNVTIGNSVISVGDGAFSDCSSLTNVTIPDSVISIGDGAFSDCSSLTNVTIPDSVTCIGDSTFSDCSSLESVTIPSSVTSIGYEAFNNCGSLKSVYITDIAVWCNIDFSNETSNPLYYASELYVDNKVVTNRLVIPDGVTKIKSYAFLNCDEFTSVRIPDSVTSIGFMAFANCYGLMLIDIPDGVTNIGASAFSGCRSMTNVTIPNSITSIGGGAFSDCSSLTNVTIPDSVTCIGDSTFSDCSSLESVTIPSSVTSIGYEAFNNCGSLKSVYITDIAVWCNIDFSNETSNPLYYASELYVDNKVVAEQLIIPDGVTNISSYAFTNCDGFTSIIIPDSVTTIEYGAFYACSSVASISLPSNIRVVRLFCDPNNVTVDTEQKSIPLSLREVVIVGGDHITDGMLKGFSLLTDITISESVTSIGNDAFRDCSGLTGITIPESVTSIGGDAFRGCSGLTGITIPDSVTSIDYQAFYGCSALTKIVIPKSVTKMENSVFLECESLIIYCEAESKPSGWSQYWNRTKRIDLDKYTYIPVIWNCTNNEMDTQGYIYAEIDNVRYTLKDGIARVAEQVKSIKGDLVIPEEVTYENNKYKVEEIEWYAFYNCRYLTSVTILSNVKKVYEYAFSGNIGLTIYCEAEIEPMYWYNNWNYSDCEVLWNCKKINGIRYSLGSYVATVVIQDKDVRGSVKIPDSVVYGNITYTVTGIVDYAFKGCSSLKSIDISQYVTSIGNGAFEGCTSLESVTILGKVTSIEDNAFNGCSSLTSINIPDSVTSIGERAFYNCSSLASIVIPKYVSSIGREAFKGCSSLKDVHFENRYHWWYSTDSEATKGTYIDLSYNNHEYVAAEYLTSTYVEYYWKRS